MRLTPEQIQHIKTYAVSIYGENVHVYLFGSRVDDMSKGGDIDLFIESENNVSFTDKLRLISLLQLSMGEQKIDVIVKAMKWSNCFVHPS